MLCSKIAVTQSLFSLSLYIKVDEMIILLFYTSYFLLPRKLGSMYLKTICLRMSPFWTEECSSSSTIYNVLLHLCVVRLLVLLLYVIISTILPSQVQIYITIHCKTQSCFTIVTIVCICILLIYNRIQNLKICYIFAEYLTFIFLTFIVILLIVQSYY